MLEVDFFFLYEVVTVDVENTSMHELTRENYQLHGAIRDDCKHNQTWKLLATEATPVLLHTPYAYQSWNVPRNTITHSTLGLSIST